jgi:hypothetical protein
VYDQRDPDTLVMHREMTPGNSPEDFKQHSYCLFTFAMMKLRIAFQLKLSSVPMTDSKTANQIRIRPLSMVRLSIFFTPSDQLLEIQRSDGDNA